MNSREWCDLVFEGRNKDYGAYELRVNSTKRYLIALLVVALLTVLPFIFFLIIVLVSSNQHVEFAQVQEMSNLVPLNSKAELHAMGSMGYNQIHLNKVSKKTVHYTVPVIKKDTEVVSGQELKSQEELSGTQAITGVMAKIDSLAVTAAVASSTELDDELSALKSVEKLPEFPGGPSAFMKWLTQNLKYPSQNLKDKIDGKVVVQFIVLKSGAISQVKVIHSLDDYCDKEVLRVINLMPKWKPGVKNGKPVLTMVVIPVMFKT